MHTNLAHAELHIKGYSGGGREASVYGVEGRRSKKVF